MDAMDILYIISLTFFPGLELRASIPYALLIANLGLSIIPVIIVLNVILGEIVFYLLNTVLEVVLRSKFLNKIYLKYVKKTQRKAEKYVKRYGTLGLAIFIGIPLPGSGAYTGALAAFLLGFPRKEFSKANIIGIIIAGTVVSAIVLSGGNIFSWLIKYY